MDAITLLTHFIAAGWEVGTQDGKLLVRHPTLRLEATERQRLTQHKAAVLAALDEVLAHEERAAILEYAGGLDRQEAERWAWQCVHRQP